MLRVLWWTPTRRARVAASATSSFTCRGTATPIVSARTTSAAPSRSSAPRSRARGRGRRRPRRAPERDADRHAHGPVGLDRRERRQRLLGRRIRFSRPKLSVAARSKCSSSRPVAAALGALRVQHEARVDDVLAALDRGDDLLRPGHLRHEPGMDEADRFDRGEAGRGEPVDEPARTAGSSTARSFWRPSRGPTSQTVTFTSP